MLKSTNLRKVSPFVAKVLHSDEAPRPETSQAAAFNEAYS